MSYHVFTLRWSQTDHESVIVEAEDKEKALAKLRSNARYTDYIFTTDGIIR